MTVAPFLGGFLGTAILMGYLVPHILPVHFALPAIPAYPDARGGVPFKIAGNPSASGVDFETDAPFAEVKNWYAWNYPDSGWQRSSNWGDPGITFTYDDDCIQYTTSIEPEVTTTVTRYEQITSWHVGRRNCPTPLPTTVGP